MSDTMTLQEAADELGWTVEELFAQMVADGMVLDHPAAVTSCPRIRTSFRSVTR